ncbi:class I SAM-dependent methyltransferase [Rhodopila sp.]|uniref:class I SAM-dependent methyltransferase n=1 Tax=Rhodopila sp. TaxID=2480087 RepID=UPI002B51599C|nr:class I SAM-dependent methyltransferase [Rhodopila sp.]HVZ06465.1 class I SAM-dependent methyltransferase [Rhodopila sp.]
MAQNIYDNPDFFAGYSRLPRQVLGLDGAPEWPAVAAMMPDLAGRRAVDLGCGFGWASRWMRQHGAESVLGIDISATMIARARADTDDPAIVYRIEDLEHLDLPRAAFDIAFSALAFHYIQDFARLSRMIFAALTPGAWLVFTIEHPIFMAAPAPDWIAARDGGRIWPVRHYAEEGERRTDWFAKGVLKYHRTMGTTLNTLIDSGFAIRRVEEFAPSPRQVAADPRLAQERERPMLLLVSAQR